ncbi:MAG: gyrase subunit, partial [Actinomycetota bacterium]
MCVSLTSNDNIVTTDENGENRIQQVDLQLEMQR